LAALGGKPACHEGVHVARRAVGAVEAAYLRRNETFVSGEDELGLRPDPIADYLLPCRASRPARIRLPAGCGPWVESERFCDNLPRTGEVAIVWLVPRPVGRGSGRIHDVV
jgi:hypothetical protein